MKPLVLALLLSAAVLLSGCAGTIQPPEPLKTPDYEVRIKNLSDPLAPVSSEVRFFSADSTTDLSNLTKERDTYKERVAELERQTKEWREFVRFIGAETGINIEQERHYPDMTGPVFTGRWYTWVDDLQYGEEDGARGYPPGKRPIKYFDSPRDALMHALGTWQIGEKKLREKCDSEGASRVRLDNGNATLQTCKANYGFLTWRDSGTVQVVRK